MSEWDAVKIAGFVPATPEMLADTRPAVAGIVTEGLRRAIHRKLYPWEYPDPPIRFELQLFPRWVERLLAATSR